MNLISSYRFKALTGGRQFTRQALPPLIGIRKEIAEPVEIDDDRTVRFCISTDCVDRDQDKIDQSGWQLDHYLKNPVVLWSHDAMRLPLGKVVALPRAKGRLSAAVKFLPAEGYGEASEKAEEVYQLVRDGWLSATSVGFRPLAWDFTDDEERGASDWFPGIDFHSQELVELSIVNVPANPEALIEPGGSMETAPARAADARARYRRRLIAALA